RAPRDSEPRVVSLSSLRSSSATVAGFDLIVVLAAAGWSFAPTGAETIATAAFTLAGAAATGAAGVAATATSVGATGALGMTAAAVWICEPAVGAGALKSTWASSASL